MGGSNVGAILARVGNLSDIEIGKLFSDYVNSKEDKPRHTAAAIEETNKYCEYLEEAYPDDVSRQSKEYERVMDLAVEYEESGFIAGFQWALNMVFSRV